MKIIRHKKCKGGVFSTLVEIPSARRVIKIKTTKKLRQSFSCDGFSNHYLYLSFPCLRFHVTSIQGCNRNFYLSGLYVSIYSNEKSYLLPLPNIDERGNVCMNHYNGYDTMQSCIDGVCQSFFNSTFNFESKGAIQFEYLFKPESYCEFLKKWVQATKDGIGLDKIIQLKEMEF